MIEEKSKTVKISEKWTPEQLRAIGSRSGNILVAASAGSGKTTVMTKRIMAHVFPENEADRINIDRMLVITFTDEAANSMKRKIEEKLREYGRKSTEKDISDKIFEQQTLLANASITTLHSFCYSVCKAYPAESGINRNNGIISGDEKTALIRKCYDKVSEKYYDAMNDDFSALCALLSEDRNDDKLYRTVTEIINRTENEPDGEDWLGRVFESKTADTESPDFALNREFLLFKSMISDIAEKYGNAMKTVAGFALDNGFEKKRGPEALIFEDIFRRIGEAIADETVLPAERLMNVRSIAGSFCNINKKDMNVDEEYKRAISDIFEKIKGRLKKIQAMIPETREELSMQYRQTRLASESLCNLVKDVLREYDEEKKKAGVIDFSDMEKGAIKILCDGFKDGNPIPSAIAMDYREKYIEVFVDEYQDINKVQDTIIRLVSRCDTDRKNLFTVGDVKQSIYGFRGSKPDMFIDRTKRYVPSEKGEIELAKDTCPGELIRLNSNFRSRKCIIDGANSIFNVVMTEETSGLDYSTNEQLRFGSLEFAGRENEDVPCEFVFSKDKSCIADNIKKIMEEDAGLKFGDIAVITSTNGEAGALAASLEEKGIRAFCEESDVRLTDCIEVAETIDFLKLVANKKNDRTMFSAMRSPYGRFTDDEIVTIRLCGRKNGERKHMTFYDACRFVSEQDTALGTKVREFFAEIFEIAGIAVTEKVSDVIWNIVNLNGFYEKCDKSAKENLQRLFFIAEDFESKKEKGLYRFVKYVSDVKNTTNWKVVHTKQDAVRLMTVHKSKGLEFKVVFYYMGSGQAGSNSESYVRFAEDTAAVRGVDDKVYFAHEAVKNYNNYRATEEKLRLLYVALTRAKERMICVCITNFQKTFGSKNKELLESELMRSEGIGEKFVLNEFSLPWEVIYHAILKGKSDKKGTWKITEEEHDSDVQPDETEEMPAEETEERETDEESKENKKMLPEVGIEIRSEIPVKISVSEIKRLRAENMLSPEEKKIEDIRLANAAKKKIKGLSFNEEEEPDGALSGTLIHTCLQYIDLDQVKIISGSRDRGTDEASVRREFAELTDDTVETLYENGIFTEKERDTVEKNVVCDFLMSDDARRMIKSERIMREVPFTVLMPWSLIVGDPDAGEEQVSVQGVIDCMFEENGDLVIYDYKSDNVSEGRIGNERSKLYETQLECYGRAAEKILGRRVSDRKLIYLRKC